MSRTEAIIFEEPGVIAHRALALMDRQEGHALVEIEASGISTGTERLLFSGEMPAFPGMGYPLVPGYEAIGRILEASGESDLAPGTKVFVPGSNGFKDARGLFGASASHLLVRDDRLVAIPERLGDTAVLLALAATAHHALAKATALPDLIVGHGVLGRLAARITVALGGAPTVWEINAARASGASGYGVTSQTDDDRRDYASILDVSGDPSLLDTLIARSAKGGEIVLAGFYKQPLTFAFPPAFMRETRLTIAAEWQRTDMDAVCRMAATGTLPLDGLLTHRAKPSDVATAYRTAFEDADCLKMIIDWSA